MRKFLRRLFFLVVILVIGVFVFQSCSSQEDKDKVKDFTDQVQDKVQNELPGIIDNVSDFIYNSETYEKIKNYEKRIADQSTVQIEAEDNEASVSLETLSTAIDTAKDLNEEYQNQFEIEASDEEEQVKEIETTVTVEVEDKDDIVNFKLDENLANADVDNILFKFGPVEITATPEALKEEFETHNGVNVSVKDNKDKSYSIEFYDDGGEEIKLSNNVVVSIASKNLKDTSVIYDIKDGVENLIGGKLEDDKLTFQTKSSGDFSTGDNKVNFTDIADEDKETQEAVIALATKGIFNTETSNFNPKGTLSRAEAVTMVTKTLYKYDDEFSAGFYDVTPNDWFYIAVASAVGEDIVKGYPDNTFRPNGMISKQELLTIASNTLVNERKFLLPTEPVAYLSTYEEEIDEWARPYVAMTIRDGIINQENATEGDSEITRAEAALILYNLFERL